ncbi:hypothetical protein HDU78_002829 [Chytriomyces hyalinus]|nr:hypothetical protein HDU78_002829 [Chytriomyces hyalinus]KAJ3266437.1 hypothetical protein HDU77_001048 [Chytriomyces hyalinus]
MDATQPIPNQIKGLFTALLSHDVQITSAAITQYYDKECKLTNPYLLLNGRDEIIKSYTSLIVSNMDLDGQIDSVVYDPATQKATVQLVQLSQPKALGGLVPLKIHQTLDLQFEATDTSAPKLLYIVSHNEVHISQEYLSNLPVLGGFYETPLRSAIGQLTLAGGEVLEKYKVLDAVPVAVEKAKSTVESATKSINQTTRSATLMANETVSKATQMASGAANSATKMASETAEKARAAVGEAAHRSGLSALLQTTSEWIAIAKDTVSSIASSTQETAATISSTAKDVAAALIEEGKGVHVSCYSPTCKPGQVCYAPTCARGRSLSVNLTVDNFQSVIRGMYLEGSKAAEGFLTPA